MNNIYALAKRGHYAVLCPIFLCLCFFSISLKTVAQTDTEFWFAVPEIAQSAPANQYDPYDRPIVLRITGGSQAGTVTISAPANPGFVPKVIALAANDVVTVDLTSEIVNLETTPSNTALNTGLLISSTAPISAYYEILANGFNGLPLNPEIYGLKGRSALGTSFLTPFQNVYDNSVTYQPVALSSFDIVATDNNTKVTITPSQAIEGHPAGVTFSIVLNKGQTYSAKASSPSRAAHLGGSKVTSDKCIAITMKDDQLYSGGEYSSSCVDQIGDQLIPISNLNNQYVIIRTRMTLPIPEKVFVLATEDNTQVSSNNVPLGTLNKGQTLLVSITANATEITASKNIYVLQLGGTGCELGSAVLPGLNWNGKPLGETQFGFVRTTEELLPINVLAPTANIGSFLVNGSATVIKATDFLPLPNVPGWSYARLMLSLADFPKGIEGVVRNTAGVFQIGILNGGQTTGASYGYFSNFKDNGCAPVVESPCTFGQGATYYGGFESAINFSATTGGSDLYNGLPRNGSYQVVKSVSDLSGGGYLNITPHSGNWFLASHTSNDASERVWYSKVEGLTPGATYSFCAAVTLLKNLGSGAKYLLGVYANGVEIGEGRVTFDWTNICGTFTAPANGKVELSIRDPKKGLFFVAIDDICLSRATTLRTSAPTIAQAKDAKVLLENSIDLSELNVKVLENPTRGNFQLRVSSNSTERIRIRMIDAFGRQVNVIDNLQSNSTIDIGNQLKTGTYFAEVTQGEARKIVKLIKM
jgi:hypothetical protein